MASQRVVQVQTMSVLKCYFVCVLVLHTNFQLFFLIDLMQIGVCWLHKINCSFKKIVCLPDSNQQERIYDLLSKTVLLLHCT